MSRARPYEAKELPIAIVQPGVQLLDTAWAQINALGGVFDQRDAYSAGYSTALNQCLSIIESLGGSDPLKRKHNRGAL